MQSDLIESGFMQFFKNLPVVQLDLNEESGRHFRFFERSENYSVHGKDALLCAETFYKTSTVLKYYNNSTIPSCSISKQSAPQFMGELLLQKGFRIEIWTQQNKKFVLSKSASPGNLDEVEDLISTSELAGAPMLACINVQLNGDQKMVGVAFTDVSTGKLIGISEFVDNDSFSNLESVLIQQSVKECIVPEESTNFEIKGVVTLLEKCDVVCTPVKKGNYKLQNIVQDLNRLLGDEVNVQTLPEYDLKVALSCIACLLSYLRLLQHDENCGTYRLFKYDLSKFMKLDASAVSALNLMPGPKDANKNQSLYGLLNRCKTAQGSRLLAQWIKQPLMNLGEITNRHDFVELFVNDSTIRQGVRNLYLAAFPDLHRLAKKFQRGRANLQDVVRIYQVIKNLPEMVLSLKEYDGKFKDLLSEKFVEPLEKLASALQKLQELAETTIDLKATDNHEYMIKADFNPELMEIKQKMNKLLHEMKKEAAKYASSVNLEFEKKLKFEYLPQYGYHMRVTRTDASKVRNERDYIELRTQKAGALFTNSKIKAWDEEYSDLTKEYGKLQSSIVKEIIEMTGSYFPVLEDLNGLTAELDVYATLAEVAVFAPVPYVRPTMTDSGNINIVGSRHPCVEMQDDVSFIENDVNMIKGESTFQIITGPNMGGKSTYIRQIGVISLMSQIGSFVPCQSTELPLIDAILARVGAGDFQLKGISTFMAEMLETASILKSATPNSLIIIDELGRGTSTKDGYGLARAIAEHIAENVGSFTLFATHFHEVTSLADTIPSVKNYHVQAQLSKPEDKVKTLTLLYKVVPGPCDQSFGIHVAELAAFPAEVVQMAKRKAAELEGFEETVVKRWKSTSDQIEQGKAIVSEFFQKLKGINQCNGGPEVEQVMQEFNPKFEASPFVQEVLHEF